MHMFNDILYIPLFLAIIASQATWTGTNPAYTAHELSNHLNKTKARYLVVEQTHLEVALEAASRYDNYLSIVIFEDLLGEMETAVPSAPRGTRALTLRRAQGPSVPEPVDASDSRRATSSSVVWVKSS